MLTVYECCDHISIDRQHELQLLRSHALNSVALPAKIRQVAVIDASEEDVSIHIYPKHIVVLGAVFAENNGASRARISVIGSRIHGSVRAQHKILWE
jgi:hypothetical protein